VDAYFETQMTTKGIGVNLKIDFMPKYINKACQKVKSRDICNYQR
jgi:hypothetical protein